MSSKPKSKSKSDHPGIDSEFTNDPGKTLFKGLKRLSLSNVHIKDERTLEKITRSCPLIEYLNVSASAGLTTIPLTIFQAAEFISELHLIGCHFIPGRRLWGPNLIVPTDQLLLIKRLKKLSLDSVYITEQTLEKIMCGCPLIEHLLLCNCVGLTNIQLIQNNSNNLKHFNGSFYKVNTQSFEIDASTIESIRIVKCPNWYGHDKYFFPRLKTLHLWRVKLSAELFESLSSNFPSLEDLELQSCYGFEEIQEIQLTACSIKRLVLIPGSIEPIKATIYAPNIHYFKFFGYCPPQLIFTSETTSGEWESHLEVWSSSKQSDNKDLNLSWFTQLSELLNSLRESQISLVVNYNPFQNLNVEDAVFCKPVPLGHVHVKGGGYESCSFPDILNCLFLICRPRYISMDLFALTNYLKNEKEKEKLVEFITNKTIQNKGEMSRGYLWERELEGISMQVSGERSQGWPDKFSRVHNILFQSRDYGFREMAKIVRPYRIALKLIRFSRM